MDKFYLKRCKQSIIEIEMLISSFKLSKELMDLTEVTCFEQNFAFSIRQIILTFVHFSIYLKIE